MGLSHLIHTQIWLNLPMGDHHFDYLSKKTMFYYHAQLHTKMLFQLNQTLDFTHGIHQVQGAYMIDLCNTVQIRKPNPN
jgi:hypothetical protein